MRRVFFLITLFCFQISCGAKHDSLTDTRLVEGEGLQIGEGGEVIVNIAFSDIGELVLEPNCISCHKNYAVYVEVKKDSEKILDAILINRMPAFGPPLGGDLKNLIEDWVNAGAPEFIIE